MQYLACLRHLIASFKTSIFSEQVSNLVYAECQTDFEELQKAYSDSWDSISDEQKKQELNDILKKVGLGMVKEKDDSGNAKEKVKPVNLNRWKQVSMIERAKFRMPSCTNQIESFHGHLNSMIPRRKEF